MRVAQTAAPEPVIRQVRVAAPPEKAFAVFAAGMGRWWPKSHTVGNSPLADVVVEPRAGGRLFERGEDGSECEWGRVIAHEPGRRLVLGWQLNADWIHDADVETEVDVRFVADGAGTLVTLEHRNLERFGARADEVRASIGGEGGWPGILVRYAETVSVSG